MDQLGAGTLTEICKEAAAWLIEMDLEPEHYDREGFLAWLRLSPHHMDEFLHQSALWVALHQATPGRIDLEQVLSSTQNIAHWPHKTARELKPGAGESTKRFWFISGAAAALTLCAVAGFWSFLHTGDTFSTAIGEQRAVRLPDRSVMHLNTDSRVEIDFSDSVREVHLIKGEALFIVEHDASRPFRVDAKGIRVEALGTEFNVRRRTADTVVSVVEGRVAVLGSRAPQPNESPAREVSLGLPMQGSQPGGTANERYQKAGRGAARALTVAAAGEMVRVSMDGNVVEQRLLENVKAAIAWRQRQLIFTNTTLADVVAEVARYNVSPRLDLEGDSLRARQISGVFAADDPESLVQFLARDPGLSVTRSDNTVRIRRN